MWSRALLAEEPGAEQLWRRTGMKSGGWRPRRQMDARGKTKAESSTKHAECRVATMQRQNEHAGGCTCARKGGVKWKQDRFFPDYRTPMQKNRRSCVEIKKKLRRCCIAYALLPLARLRVGAHGKKLF
ncbi:hypothetical protein NDU88_004083 [Pleurodeles waltl]|uniref:Uncharacterized protein n=1 Tax=Pleurodeles waltl TaxID=8319 RepID=A0AAV7UF42_PLEWA|nr:hypothetical protein NDU88_004083 [Pleurodeles waltl]